MFGKLFRQITINFQDGLKEYVNSQAECYKSEKKWSNIFVVRPANVYGPYDNFDTKNVWLFLL